VLCGVFLLAAASGAKPEATLDAPKSSEQEPSTMPIRDDGLKDYVTLSKRLPHSEERPWTLVCTLPHNAQFQPSIEVEASEGKTIVFESTNHLAKWMQPNQEYTTTEGVQTHEVPGWISGQGVVYAIPAGVTVRAVKYRETGYDTDFSGSFHCNDNDYNILWKKATRTCYLCMRDHFMDCPDRERTPLCLGDVCIQMEEIFYAFDLRAHEIAKQSILRNPNYTHIIDQNLMFAGEYGTWFYYLNTGDLDTIRQQYPNLKAYLEKWPLAENGVVKHNTDGWDWCDWGSPSKDKTVVQCAQYYSTLTAFRKMAVATGNTDDLPEIDRKLESIKSNFDAVFWRGNYYMSDAVTYPDERANAMAVITGLASPDKWDAIFENVLSRKLCPTWEDGNTYNASSYFERWIMEALCKMGKEEFALLRMADRYRDQIYCRTTTLWEHFGRWWQTKFDPNSTMNHGWNSPNTVLSRYIAGVAPTSPGWSTFEVLPKEAFLRSLAVGLDTIKGRVEMDLLKTAETYSLAVSVPVGARATIGIPTSSFSKLNSASLNGATIWDGVAPTGLPVGVECLGIVNGHLRLSVPAGDWKFVAHGTLPLSEAKAPRPAPTPSKRIDSSNWITTASHTHTGPTLSYEYGKKEGGSPADAIDRDVWRGWSTGIPQEPGQWYAIDFGKAETFDTIRIENGWAPYDYLRSYELYVSDDGQNWGEPVATGKGTPAITTIHLPARTCRHIKLVSRGASTYWWSMFEIDVLSTPADDGGLTREERIEWWKDGKFGMFIHWGLYAIPAGTWGDKVYKSGYSEWIMFSSKIPVATYRKLAGEFNPVKFEASAWAELANDAGMKYMVLTAKHHDGFSMYDSALTDYDVVNATPYGRDVTGELAKASRQAGLHFGCYYSVDRDWFRPTGPGNRYQQTNTWDFPESTEADFDRYFEDFAKPQVEELLVKYKADLIWFDGISMKSDQQVASLYQSIRKLRPEVVLNSRIHHCTPPKVIPPPFCDYLSTGDNEISERNLGFEWENPGSMNTSYGYNQHDHQWRSTTTIIHNLVDSVSKGGNYLLNVGPTAEGLIPEPCIVRLREVGRWMEVHGEAIYATSTWPAHAEKAQVKGGDPVEVRYTLKGDTLYATCLSWPAGELTLKHATQEGRKVASCQMLGSEEEIKWSVGVNGLKLSVPEHQASDHAHVYRIQWAAAD